MTQDIREAIEVLRKAVTDCDRNLADKKSFNLNTSYVHNYGKLHSAINIFLDKIEKK